jgi:hypothetical protein
MVFNATFNNISVILWRSVLLVEETGETTDLLQVTDKLYHIEYRVHNTRNPTNTVTNMYCMTLHDNKHKHKKSYKYGHQCVLYDFTR